MRTVRRARGTCSRVVITSSSRSDEPIDLRDFERLQSQLIAEFTPRLRPEEVQRCLVTSITSYQHAPVRTYLSVLIERAARDQLRSTVTSRAAQDMSPPADGAPTTPLTG